MFTLIPANDASQAKRQPIVFNAWKHGAKRAFLDLNIKPRSHLVKRTLLNLVLPSFAIAAIAVALVFPKPTDLQATANEIASRVSFPEVANPRGTDARPIVENYADVVPGLQRALDENADCFLDLDQATPDKLERCAPAVTEVIAQVVAYQDNPEVQRALQNDGNQRLVQQLQVAATEVCRSVWSGGNTIDHGLDSPACLVAQVQLVPVADIR